jgi:hypothetical protein
VSRVSIFIATTSPDIKAEVIASAVKARRGEMDYAGYRELRGDNREDEEVDEILKLMSLSTRSALVLVGLPDDTKKYTGKFLAHRADLVVLQVDLVGANVRIELRNPQLSQLLNALRQLVERFGARASERPKNASRIPGRLREHPDRSLTENGFQTAPYAPEGFKMLRDQPELIPRRMTLCHSR